MRTPLILGMIVLAGASQAANLVVNGDFESPSVGGWGLYTNISGWTASADKIEIGQGAGTYSVAGATGQVLELDANNNATVDQSIAMAAGNYTLSFDYARRRAGMVGRNLDTANFDVLWNGQVVFSGVDLSSTTMANQMVSVSAVSGSNLLQFRGMGTNDSYGAIIDNVSVEAVPEPASMAALGAGVLAAIRRRKGR